MHCDKDNDTGRFARRFNITKEFLEEQVALGKKVIEIANLVGCSDANIRIVANKFGVKLNQREFIDYSALPTRDAMLQLVTDGKMYSEIAKEYNVKHGVIQKLARKYNLPRQRDFKINLKQDFTGRKFGKLTVLERAPDGPGGAIRWKSQCECGNTTITPATNLVHNTTKSCGCTRKSRQWQIIPSYIWNGMKGRAKSRGLEFTITKEYVEKLFLDQDKRCALTLRPLHFVRTKNKRNFNEFTTASLDRIDNNVGYVEGNVRWLYKKVNYMKQDFEEQEFLQLCKEIANNQQEIVNPSPVGADVLILGGTGFVGKNLTIYLKQFYNVVSVGSEYDLRKESECFKLFCKYNPRCVVNLAAKVAGIGGNILMPGDFFRDNALIGINCLHAAKCLNISKYIQFASVCGYPANPPIPFTESSLWLGESEPTNNAYGTAKKSMITMADAYNQQFGYKTITLIPSNLYGKFDNVDPTTSHIVPAIIRKVYYAKKNNVNHIELWGDGTPTRDLTYVNDVCEAVRLCIENCQCHTYMNVGSEKEISVDDLAKTILKISEYDCQIKYNSTKPNGQQRRLLDCSKIKSTIGWSATTNIEDGLRETYNWFSEAVAPKLTGCRA